MWDKGKVMTEWIKNLFKILGVCLVNCQSCLNYWNDSNGFFEINHGLKFKDYLFSLQPGIA